MQFIFGLGNPGEKYEKTRHNAGAICVRSLAQKSGVHFSEQKKLHSLIARDGDTIYCVPTTYMNESGQAVGAVLRYFAAISPEVLANTVLCFDDLDLELGTSKLAFGKGPKVHNGLNSVIAAVKSQEFWHLRIGVDSRQGLRNIPGSAYVLSTFSTDECIDLERAIDEVAIPDRGGL